MALWAHYPLTYWPCCVLHWRCLFNEVGEMILAEEVFYILQKLVHVWMMLVFIY